ncbi:PEP-CTERM sorting domain-containing protein [Kiritimatiellaeota bacterium B1221]|nr:PEP-CTERM sorting domain-containing protein [Kiritimatiellaeota bacterium B1221]
MKPESSKRFNTILSLSFSVLSCSLSVAEPVSLQLSGNNATGALNILGFDNEISEPGAPASNDHVGDGGAGTSSSHGFPYYQYVYDDANPDAFNDYAPRWSILISSHTVNNQTYYESVLAKAGAVAYDNLTLDTQILHPNPSAFNFGSIEYESSLLTGVGTEIIAIGDFSFTASKEDYNFNVLDESGTYYYETIDLLLSVSVDNLSGTGLTFENGVLTSMDFVGDAKVLFPANEWVGTFTASGMDVAYDIADIDNVAGFGDAIIVLDRAGTVAIPEPGVLVLLGLGLITLFHLKRKKHNHL